MIRSKKTEKEKERDRKGKERIRRFEESQKVVEKVENSVVSDDGEYEEYFITVNQKTDDHDWQEIRVPYRRKKK